jgi:small-conductance mechanosensitive channel
MARRLDKTVQKAGLSSWWRRRTLPLSVGPEKRSVVRETVSVRPDPVMPPQPVSFGFNYNSLALTLYCFAVLLGTLVLGHLAATGVAAWEIGALVVVLLNFAAFFLAVPKNWESEIRFSAFLLMVVGPTIYIMASVMGLWTLSV